MRGIGIALLCSPTLGLAARIDDRPASAPASRPAAGLGALLARARAQPELVNDGLEAAVVALGAAASPELAAALASEATTCRGPALARALARLQRDAALPALRALAKHGEVDARRSGIAGLARLQSAESVALLVESLGDESAAVAKAATESLVDLEKAAPALRVRAAVAQTFERGRNATARVRAVDALVKLGGPDLKPMLERALRDGENDVRCAAAGALGSMGQASDAGRSELVAMLADDPEPAVRKQAAISLGRLKERAACPGLVDALGSDDAGLRSNAHWALKAISGKLFPPNQPRWREWWQREGSRTP